MKNFLKTIRTTGLEPIIKWAGGKESELSFIFDNLPEYYENYYEPFVGGGSVFASITAEEYFINDASEELIRLYRCVAERNESFNFWIKKVIEAWQSMLKFACENRELCKKYIEYREDILSDEDIRKVIELFINNHANDFSNILAKDFQWHRDVYASELRRNLLYKIQRMKKIERSKHIMPPSDIFDNIETALVSSLYMYFRCLYNNKELMKLDDGFSTAIFVFIRNYSYCGMFRYNKQGDFNVPYGGISYNHKSLEKKIGYYNSPSLYAHFNSTRIFNLDFEDFLKENPPRKNDFIFLDPPYDSTFSTYDKNVFSLDDQKRLANYLISVCEGKWMMIIKNTPFIYSLYCNEGLNIKCFDKKYMVSFMNRNDKAAEHLIIMNY